MTDDQPGSRRDELLAQLKQSGSSSPIPKKITPKLAGQLIDLAEVINKGDRSEKSNSADIKDLILLHEKLTRSLSCLAAKDDENGNQALDHLISCFTESIVSMHLLDLRRLRDRAKSRYSFPFIVSPHRSGLEWLKNRIRDLELSDDLAASSMSSRSHRDAFAGVAWGILSSLRIPKEDFQNWSQKDKKEEVRMRAEEVFELYPDLEKQLIGEIKSASDKSSKARKKARVHETIFERFETLNGHNKW